MPADIIKTFILMQHEGGFHLDDVRHLHEDEALCTVLNLKALPQATTLGGWLRRVGRSPHMTDAWVAVNQRVLRSALHRCRKVTLDIDATEIVSNKKSAQWTYKKNKGFMPMVGHIAEVEQVMAVDFRRGNEPLAKDNLGFIKQCQQSLPPGCEVKALHIDATGYQEAIIQYCDDEAIEYAIRAKSSAAMRAQIQAVSESDWEPLLDKSGEPVPGQDTHRTSFCIGDYEKASTLVIQRKACHHQAELFDTNMEGEDEINLGGYVYRAIATNRDSLSDSKLIHWYNQRAEDSENRIKELKLDFGADTLPCSDFEANALYFLITALSYNLFALMRHLLPEQLSRHRALTIRSRIYSIAAKVMKTGRQLWIKCREHHKALLEAMLMSLKAFKPPPI